jgi:hypothetical protein
MSEPAFATESASGNLGAPNLDMDVTGGRESVYEWRTIHNVKESGPFDDDEEGRVIDDVEEGGVIHVVDGSAVVCGIEEMTIGSYYFLRVNLQ